MYCLEFNKLFINNINSTLTQQFTTALSESAVSTMTSTAIQSAINGDSFSETLKEQGINTLVGAVSNLGAKQIGMNYHTGNIGKATQLTLHAGLGALTSGLTGNDMLSGAISGVMGEVVGEYFGNNTNLSNDALKEIGGLAGGVSSLIAGKLQGLEDDEIVSNIFTGQRLGKNAVENNFLYKDIVDATLEYRDFKKTITGNNIGYEDEDYEDTVVIPQEVEDAIYLGEKSGEILDSLATIPLEIYFMNGGIDYNLSLKNGVFSFGFNLSALNIAHSEEFFNTGIGNIEINININLSDREIVIGGGVSAVNAEVTKQLSNGLSVSASGSAGGFGFEISNKGFEYSTGADFDVTTKLNIKDD